MLKLRNQLFFYHDSTGGISTEIHNEISEVIFVKKQSSYNSYAKPILKKNLKIFVKNSRINIRYKFWRIYAEMSGGFSY